MNHYLSRLGVATCCRHLAGRIGNPGQFTVPVQWVRTFCRRDAGSTLALLLAGCLGAQAASPTAFTYQGRLNADGGPATSLYDFEFRLFAVETNGMPLADVVSVREVPVTNGLFQTTMDFGPGVFNGESRWLEIAVKNSFTDDLPHLLSPRQALTATPYALHARNAGGLMTYSGAPLDITLNGERVMQFQPATSPTLGFIPNTIIGVGNEIQSNVFGAAIGGGSGNLIHTRPELEARHGTIGGGTGNVIFNSDYATIAGGASNWIDFRSAGAFIGGGRGNRLDVNSTDSVIAGGSSNVMSWYVDASTIGGGTKNRMVDDARYSTIAGGRENLIGQKSDRSTIGGGSQNRVISQAPGVTISGGVGNSVGGFRARMSVISGGESNQANRPYSTVVGGTLNLADGTNALAGGYRVRASGLNSTAFGTATEASGPYSTAMGVTSKATGNQSTAFGHSRASGELSTSFGYGHASGYFGTAMGQDTVASGNSSTAMGWGTVASGPESTAMGWNSTARGLTATAMGWSTVAAGQTTLAAGYRAKATNDGAFVWADLQDADFTSTGTNQFLIRASGGVGINTDSPEFALHVNGDAGKPGGGAWSVASDARLKKDIRPLEQALARLLQLHGVTYEYKNPEAIHELPGQQTGMIAQEVEKVFPDWVENGRDGMRRLSIRGFEALTVEALRELRAEKDEQIRARDSQINAMEKRLSALEAKMSGGESK